MRVLGSGVLLLFSAFSQPALSQDCRRPRQGECITCPKGGEHTGVSMQGQNVNWEVPQGKRICVYFESIRGSTFARFSSDGSRWPSESWAVTTDFCFLCNP